MSVFFVGLSFWKCGSRKIYAVRVTTHVPLKGSAKSKAKASYSSCYDISDDSDEDFTPKKTRGDNHGDIQIVNSQINEVKLMVSDTLKVNQILSLPLGVVKLIRDAFICKICLSTPMKPPVIASKCCNSLIGCEECKGCDVKQGTVVNLNILFHILIQVKQLFSQSFMNGFENHDLPFLLSRCNKYSVS